MMTFQLGITNFDRLTYHSDRLDLDKSEILRAAIHAHLSLLDEEEAFTRANRAAQKRTGIAKIGELPGGVGTKGMNYGLKEKDPPPSEIEEETSAEESEKSPGTSADPVDESIPPEIAENVKIPRKLKKSFRSRCEFVEAATGAMDRSMRLATVSSDFIKKTSHSEGTAAFLELQNLLRARASTVKRQEIISAPPGIKITIDPDSSDGDD